MRKRKRATKGATVVSLSPLKTRKRWIWLENLFRVQESRRGEGCPNCCGWEKAGHEVMLSWIQQLPLGPYEEGGKGLKVPELSACSGGVFCQLALIRLGTVSAAWLTRLA